MLRRILIAAAVVVVLPTSALAQSIGFGVAARGGSLGLGGEVAASVTRYLGVRVGIGVLPITYDGDVEEVRYHVEATSPLTNIGVDFYPGIMDFRIGGGLMFIPNATTFEARYTGDITIDDQQYTDAQVGTLVGELDHGSRAPYVLIGLGRHTSRGLGIYLDVGAAFLEEQRMRYTATGPIANDPDFQQALDAEASAVETEVNDFMKIYPILSAGIRFGFL